MRSIVSAFILLTHFNGLFGQVAIEGVEVSLKINGKQFSITEIITLHDFEGEEVQFQSIKTMSSSIDNLSFINAEIQPVESSEIPGILEWQLTSEMLTEKLTIQYDGEINLKKVQIPLIYPLLKPKVNPKSDLFKLDIEISGETDYDLKFPSSYSSYDSNEGLTGYKSDLSVVPSMVILSSEERSLFSFSNSMDYLTFLIFVLVGIMIWRYRHRLKYG